MKNILIISIAFLVYHSLHSQVEWHRVNLTTNEDLNEITFINDSVGFIAGNKGVLLKTTNKGIDWIELNSPDTFDIVSIAFTDEMNGAVLSGMNNIWFYVTTDGGITWEQKSPGIGGFCFPKVLHALEDKILIGGNGCFYGDGISVYQNDSIVMDTMLGITNFISNFDFIDSQIGFASSSIVNTFLGYSRLYKTIDGGLTWNVVTNNDSLMSLYDIAFIDEDTGYCVSIDTTIYGSETPAVLFKTTDGGNTWTDVIGQLFVTPTFTDIEIVHEDSIIAVGSYVSQFSDNGTVWLNYADTNLQWFTEDWEIDTLSPRVKKNDVLENNACVYVVGDNGFLSKSCLDSSEIVNTSIEFFPKEKKIKLFPNPSDGIFILKIDDANKKEYTFRVFTVLGQEVYQRKMKLSNSQENLIFDFSSFEYGNYFFSIANNNNRIITKISILE